MFLEKWTPIDGLGALIISPTRELAYQTFHVLRTVGKFHDFSAGLVIGGKVIGPSSAIWCWIHREIDRFLIFLKNLREESEKINNTNIIICTPGRLLQHMDETFNFNANNLQILGKHLYLLRSTHSHSNHLHFVHDVVSVRRGWPNSWSGFRSSFERDYRKLASRTTDPALLRYTNQVRAASCLNMTSEIMILNYLLRSLKDLVRLSLKEPVYVSVHENAEDSTPTQLVQVRSFTILYFLPSSVTISHTCCDVTSFSLF